MTVFKDRQHRSKGGMGFLFIAHQPKGVEYCVIYQTKARIFVYSLMLSSNIFPVNWKNCEIKTDFFTFIFCANTSHLILIPQQ